MQKTIYIGLIAVFAVALGVAPISVQAASNGKNYTFGSFETDYGEPTPPDYVSRDNPEPIIRSLYPRSGNRGAGMESVTINGVGFVPSSIARINGTNRPTTFIDSSHLMVQVDLNEPYRTKDGVYVTVLNSPPGGGYSNAAFFKLEGNFTPLPANPNTSYNYGTQYGNGNYQEYPGQYPAQSNYEGQAGGNTSLASSVILGERTFLPSSLVQWVFTAILILAIIILVRKVFGHREVYDTTPLKHA